MRKHAATTPVDRALRWWATHDGDPIPGKHYRTLCEEGYVADELLEGFYTDLSPEGKAALAAHLEVTEC